MANRSSFGPMVLAIAAMSCSFYVACGDDDVIFEPTAGTGGMAGRSGGGGTGGTSAGTGGTSAGTGGTSAGTGGTGGTSAGTGGTGGSGGSGIVDVPDAGGDAGPDSGIITPND